MLSSPIPNPLPKHIAISDRCPACGYALATAPLQEPPANDPAPSEARVATHDGFIWPVERRRMADSARIIERMAEDLEDLRRQCGGVTYLALQDIGWTKAQCDAHALAAVDRASRAEIARRNAPFLNEDSSRAAPWPTPMARRVKTLAEAGALAAFVGFIALAAIAVDPRPARAAGDFPDASPEQRAWFGGLTRANGDVCCDHTEAHAVEDYWWTGNGYRLRVGGVEIDAPAADLVKQPNRYGMGIVWIFPAGAPVASENVRCFLRGAEI